MGLDILKGLLVVAMILYHWLNYFVSREGEFYRYIRFVTPSFVFMAGFLITNIYPAKYRIGDRDLHVRLVLRGLRLLAVFTGLNIAVGMALERNYNGVELGLARFIAVAPTVYSIGGARGAVFEVLVSIAYILIASSAILLLMRLHRHLIFALWLILFIVILCLRSDGITSANLELFSMGLLGMAFGVVRLETLDRVTRPVSVWVCIYAVYLVVLNFVDQTYEVQVVGLVLTMTLLYILAARMNRIPFLFDKLRLLGQYSLLAYIAQIAVLQVLVRAMRDLQDQRIVYCSLSLVAALVLTFVVSNVTDVARHAWSTVDRVYRLVFA